MALTAIPINAGTFFADVRKETIKTGMSVCASVRRRYEWELCGRKFSTLFLYLSDAEDAHAAWKYRQFLFIFIFFTFKFLGIWLSVSATHRTVYRSF